jgi:hypothetical protein
MAFTRLPLGLLAALILTTPQAHAVIHVGNPSLHVGLWTPPASGWTVDVATAASASASLQGCASGAWTSWTPGSPSGLLASFPSAPAGGWCALEVELLDVTLHVDGPSGRRVEAKLNAATLAVSFTDEVDVAGSGAAVGWLHAIGTSWLATAEIYVDPNETKVIDEHTAGYAALLAAIEASAVYVDSDADGALDPAEHAAGPIAD